ncbi:pyridoxal phosphate-dependent aminotransferase [Sediminivirga luteola]|uniref:pyridoxal phosphate-dependent aminotransferase n=1 Tax=Sediminivirga luteola TaxID=1774748 RepID=UPI001F592837|nr:aminotransferase class I/II-fold pyridoxal phosphate-dependent enzyme [Sediminivirga luteola]MCI2265058.1 aminotransferase class I/II-fold pyridoxal phosphate-dependent enzyme [Sediminivirga luteola]
MSTRKISARGQVPGFTVMSILDRLDRLRAAGRDVISLCAGEPAQGAPGAVRARAAEVHLDGTPLGYSAPLGIPELRGAIAAHYGTLYGLDVTPAQVAVTTGSSGAFLLSFLAAFDAGDRVALARPGYPAYRTILSSLGVEVVELDCGPAQRFQPTVDQLARVHAEAPLAGLMLASPANPTGTMIDRDQMQALAGWARAAGVRIVSDEIYHGISFTGSPGVCAWEADPEAIIISSFSKYWGMTGWRLGWALIPEDLQEPVAALAGNYALCPPVPAQHAAVRAFSPEALAEAGEALAGFARARQLVLDALPQLGWVDVAPADGAFYFYAGIGPVLGPHADASAWATALLEEEGVAVVPGDDFDPVEGQRFIRLSLAAGEEAVAEALRRILAFQARL